MHYKIKYHNKPHDLKLSCVRIVLLAKGIWLVNCDLNLRGYDIAYHGSEDLPNGKGSRYHSVGFDDDKDIRAELILYPDTAEEANLTLEVSQIHKTTYYSVLVSSRCFTRSWEAYCKKGH